MIEPSFLRADDFQGFFDARLKALSELISTALGKTVVESHGSNEMEVEIVDESEIAPVDAEDDLATV